MLKYLLDTNIVIYVIKARPRSVLTHFNRHAEQMAVSSITVAELYYGVENSSQPTDNRRVVESFLSRLFTLAYDDHAAAHYGEIKATLKKQGQIIGENDLHIAAHARSHGLIIVTNNTREFERVPGLRVENWLAEA